ncbi:DUF7529 family protein [Halorarius litoreus]|uniref:DUF7529 family protein n=1 Tax=Halorarius litoreus TaxID=2962676 RepID=UPI0020CC5FA8|nr:hypothetical protein [Halorarius litoreus]
MSADNPFGKVVGHWEAVVEDMEETATQYRNAGWETVELHPGDVTVVPADHEQFGIVAIAPDDEFAALLDIVEGRTFDSYEVYRGDTEGVVFLLVVVEADAADAAVFLPAYYERTESGEGELRKHEGVLHTRVRNLQGDEIVEFTHENPEPFFPDERFDAEE